MLAARIDQENAIHARQTAAAAKPLNQGVQGLGAKTPGNRAPKTPFKIALNDENEVDKFGKGGFGTNGKGLGGKQQGGKATKNLFQTPAPRDRPALGFKTTNAKATAFQTPAPKAVGPSPEKTQRKTVGRSRIQIHQEEVKEAEPEVDWGNEDIQYIPPKSIALPDVPSDDEWDKVDFSILKTGNFEGGRFAEFYARRQAQEDAEEAQWRREDQKKMKREDEESLQKILDGLRESDSEDSMPVVKTAAPTKRARDMGTIASRSAAAALSRPAKSSATPSYAAPTVAARAKAPISSVLGHKKTNSFSNGATGRATSYNTLGYAKGRAVSSTLRQQSVPGVFKDEAPQPKPKKKDPLKELEEMISAREYEEAGIQLDDLDDISVGGVLLPGADDEDEDVFQFKIPEA